MRKKLLLIPFLLTFFLFSTCIEVHSLSSTDLEISGKVSLTEIKTNIETLSNFQTRYVGTMGLNNSALFIKECLENFNISVKFEYFEFENHVLINVIGELPSNSSDVIVLGAHYDSRAEDEATSQSSAPGAEDNGSGVAVLIEIARILSQYTLSRSVIFVFFSGEEVGRVGSQYWLQENYHMLTSIKAALIFDMVAYGSGYYVESDFRSDSLAQYARAISVELGYPLSIGHTRYLSDQTRFWDQAIPTILFHDDLTYFDTPYYHSVNDVPDNLNYTLATEFAKIGAVVAYHLATDSTLPISVSPIDLQLFLVILLVILSLGALTAFGLRKFLRPDHSIEDSNSKLLDSIHLHSVKLPVPHFLPQEISHRF